jgi:putative transposase
LHRLDLAFAAFFSRVKRGHTAGFPRFKGANGWKQLEFSHGGRALRFNSKQSRVIIPGVGSVRLRKGRPVPLCGRAWVVERNGRWWACFEVEREVQPNTMPALLVGIDRGIHVLAATSDGVLHRQPSAIARQQRSIARIQRLLEAVTDRDEAGRVRNRAD